MGFRVGETVKYDPFAAPAGTGFRVGETVDYDPFAASAERVATPEIDAPADRGFIGDIVSRAARGGLGVVENISGAMRMSDLDPTAEKSSVAKMGKALADFAEETEGRYDIFKPDIAEVRGEEGFLKRGFGGTVQSVPLSMIPLGGGIAGGALAGTMFGPIGTAVGATIGAGTSLFATFFLGEYQNAYSEADEHLRKQGLPEEEIKTKSEKHALITAGSEFFGEGLGDLASLTFLGLIGKNAIKQGVKQSIKQIIKGPGFFKALVKAAPFEAGSEMGTAYLQTKSAQELGLTKMTPAEGVAEAILPAIFMSVFFGSAVRGMQTIEAQRVFNSLNSENPNERVAAIDVIAKRLPPEDAKIWLDTAEPYLESGKGIPLSTPIIDISTQDEDAAETGAKKPTSEIDEIVSGIEAEETAETAPPQETAPGAAPKAPLKPKAQAALEKEWAKYTAGIEQVEAELANAESELAEAERFKLLKLSPEERQDEINRQFGLPTRADLRAKEELKAKVSADEAAEIDRLFAEYFPPRTEPPFIPGPERTTPGQRQRIIDDSFSDLESPIEFPDQPRPRTLVGQPSEQEAAAERERAKREAERTEITALEAGRGRLTPTEFLEEIERRKEKGPTSLPDRADLSEIDTTTGQTFTVGEKVDFDPFATQAPESAEVPTSVVPDSERTSADYILSTEDFGDIEVKIIRHKDGSVTLFDSNGVREYNAAFSKGKSDTDIIKYSYEPAGYKGIKEASEKSKAPPTPEGTDVAPEGGVGEPWEMTKDEYAKVVEGEHVNAVASKTNTGRIIRVNIHSDALDRLDKDEQIASEGFLTSKGRYVSRDEAALLTGGDYWKNVLSGEEEGSSEGIFAEPEEGESFGNVQHREYHKEVVKQALSDGETVPESVLKDYPDLKAKQSKDTTPDIPRERDTGRTATAPLPETIAGYPTEQLKTVTVSDIGTTETGEQYAGKDTADAVLKDLETDIERFLSMVECLK